jgi:UDP-N-acetylmuramoyl-L-alanyl-D-glutamate--2,6-diaminopimelate ligase
MMAAQATQPGIHLSLLLEDYLVVEPSQDVLVTGLTLDSREVRAGSLFLACSGNSQHGMNFFDKAVQAGAAAIVYEPTREWDQPRVDALSAGLSIPVIPLSGLSIQVSRIAGHFYNHPSENLYLVGVTGTNGKTSCTQYLAQAFSPDLHCAVIGTLGSGFHGEMEVGTHTTPDPVALQSRLAVLKVQGAEAVAMEVSSHALDQGRAEDLKFDVALLTNLSRDHLDYHGSMAQYAASKARLFSMPGLKAAVLNLDDPFGRQMLEQLPGTVEPVCYGLESHVQGASANWLVAESVQADSKGLHLRIRSSWGEGEINSSLLGRFNASNLLGVLGVLLYQGVPFTAALQRLSVLQTAPGRMEPFGGEALPLVVVDFAHTPDALEHALSALRGHAGGELVCVFGCGGDRDQGKRPQMGAIAARLADRVVVTDDNPRSEDGDAIVAQILAGMSDTSRVRVERNRAHAIESAVASSVAGDVILVAGKGHETYQQVGDLRLPFSDREKVVQVLAEVNA